MNLAFLLISQDRFSGGAESLSLAHTLLDSPSFVSFAADTLLPSSNGGQG